MEELRSQMQQDQASASPPDKERTAIPHGLMLALSVLDDAALHSEFDAFADPASGTDEGGGRRRMDKNGLAKLMRAKGLAHGDAEIASALARVDANKDGEIDFGEFRALARANSDPAARPAAMDTWAQQMHELRAKLAAAEERAKQAEDGLRHACALLNAKTGCKELEEEEAQEPRTVPTGGDQALFERRSVASHEPSVEDKLLSELGVEVVRCASGERMWRALLACARSPNDAAAAAELGAALQEEPSAVSSSFSPPLGWTPSFGTLVRVGRMGQKQEVFPGLLGTVRKTSHPACRSTRYAVFGATFSGPEQAINQWAELSEVRLFDEKGVNVAAQAAEITWLLEPAGNKDPRALVNGTLWPKEPFPYWDREEGQEHNGVGLVEFVFKQEMHIVGAELFSTNTESFGTNPTICVWHHDRWVPHLACDPGAGLAVIYLADNSPVATWPADGRRQHVIFKHHGVDTTTCIHPQRLVHALDGLLPLHAAAALKLPTEHVRMLLKADSDAAATPSADGTLPFELALYNDAPADVLACLWQAAGPERQQALTSSPGLLWHLVVDPRHASTLELLCSTSDSSLRTKILDRICAIKASARLFHLFASGSVALQDVIAVCVCVCVCARARARTRACVSA